MTCKTPFNHILNTIVRIQLHLEHFDNMENLCFGWISLCSLNQFLQTESESEKHFRHHLNKNMMDLLSC